MRNPVWISAFLTVAIGLWMASGYFAADSRPAPVAETRQVPPINVAVLDVQAAPVQQELLIQGEVQARRVIQLRAETSGRIVALPVEKGRRVESDIVVAKIAVNERPAKLREARALVNQRKGDLAAARKLERRQMQAKNQVAEAIAQFEAARAYEEQLRIDLANTDVRAPFSAIVNAHMAEVGDFVDRGDPIAELVDDSVLRVKADVPQHSVGQLKLGVPTAVTLITGEELVGRLVYVAARADVATRSFPIEVEVANEKRMHAIGMSAELRIPTQERIAHFVSLSTLTLNDKGEIGVKMVDEQAVVRFVPVEVVRSQPDGAWVGGLPNSARVIVRGQGFVRQGDTVDVTLSSADERG